MRVAGATRGSARGVTDIRIGSDDWLALFCKSVIELTMNILRIIGGFRYNMQNRKTGRRENRIDERIACCSIIFVVRAIIQLNTEKRPSVTALDKKKIDMLGADSI
jgi:hypothetical protein